MKSDRSEAFNSLHRLAQQIADLRDAIGPDDHGFCYFPVQQVKRELDAIDEEMSDARHHLMWCIRDELSKHYTR